MAKETFIKIKEIRKPKKDYRERFVGGTEKNWRIKQ